ncbi:MAG: hypothetical protein ACR2HF_10750, partial [Methylococcaceae bacterium]
FYPNQNEDYMKNFAFISRHEPTTEQTGLSLLSGINLIPVGDRDGFNMEQDELDELAEYDGVIMVHLGMGLAFVRHCREAGKNCVIGVFENGSRPGPDEKPQFVAKELRFYSFKFK